MAFLPADILQRLRRAREVGRLPHAILLTGAPGSGHVALAMDLAALVNDIPAAEAASHPDIHTLEPESKSRRILVESFKAFCTPFFATSFRPGATKIGIIFDVDRLQLSAANAFLKTLEEPPPNCLFILVTTSAELLPVTIVSRCSHFAVHSATRATHDDLPARLIAASTGELLAAPARGRTGAALRLAHRLKALLREARTSIEEEVSSAFKAEKKRLGDTADEDWIKDEEARLKALTEARAAAVRHRLVGVISERTADVLRARHGIDRLHFPEFADESRRLAGSYDDTSLLRVLDAAATIRVFLDRNVKEEFALEAGCLALART